MQRALTIIFFVFFCHIVLGQLSIGLNGGLGSMRRDIPTDQPKNLYIAGMALDINYQIDSTPIRINVTPYLLSNSVSEFRRSKSFHLSVYHTQLSIMSGVGLIQTLGRFVNISASLQVGYWYTHSNHYAEYFNTNEVQYIDFERRFSQFAVGPKIDIGFGKKNLKANIILENYFLSASPESSFGRERFSRIALGLSYSLAK